ncbi:polyketide synthase [Chloropicon primus]|uniref:Polyketide synthase n=2 Tax=Chloropicon primus TaxID=1764295 RepID=A0A5B8MQX5_9CHLO|nr:polyketide synthase [Chloropicon primus]|eukprot:QDZ22813.1 polyketide synthase [Chloropicon primus]
MGTQSPLLHLRDVNPLVVNVLEAQAQKGGKSVQLPRYSSAECSDSESGVQSVYGASGFAFQGTNAHALLTPSNGSLLNASHKDRRSMSSTWKGVRCWIVSHQRSLLVEQFVLSSRSTNTATVETCLIGHPLLASLNEYDVCGRQVLCASAFVAMAAKTMEMLHANSDSRPWLVHVLFTSTLALSGEAVSSGVVQCEVALSSGNVLVRSKDEGTNSPHMTCSAHNLDTVDSSTSTEHHEVLDGARLYLGQSGSAGQGKLVPCQPSFEDEHALQGVGSLESSLHLMDSVTSSSSDGFELQARIPASVEACILSTSSLGVSLHAVGSATEVGRVTQSSQIDASPCLVDKLSFRVISSKEDISIPTVGGVSSSRDILDACKLYNICWYAQTPVVSSDVLTASEPATQLHVEESAICPHHILAGMQDLVEKGTDALWMHSSGSLDTSASPAGLHKDHGASGYMSWAMLRCIALECTSVQCGGVDTSPLHPSASARGLQFSSKSYAMDVTVDVFGCSMDNGSLYLPQLTLQRDTTQTHAVMNGSHHLGKGRRHVVTGGLSGIGQMVGGWCVRSSLGSSLGLLGRTGKSRTCPEELRAGDMSVSMARCDVSVREEASWWMMERCDDLYPLGMVVHAAGVLIDAILGNQSPSHMRGSLSPKLRGAQWIQAGSWSAALGVTVHFSSISSLVGSPGQINYACSNSGLEMMSNRQKMSGIASLAIQWGIWKAVGMASNKVVSKRFESMGLAAISPDSGLSILSSCLHMKEEGTVCANQAAFWSNVLSSSTKCPSFFKQICPASIVDEIPKPHQEKRVVRSQHEVQPIIEQVSQSVQRLLQQDIDINTPLMEAGLDSLGVVELRNTISSSVGVQLPSTVILDYPSINALTTFICGELGLQEGKSVQELHEVLPSAEMGVTRCVALNSFSALLPVATTMKPGAGIGDAITSVPFGRWDLERSEAMMPSGQLTARFAGLLKDVSTFDTACFGMSVTEASLCDPQQRLLLQVSWESMQSCVLNDAQDSSNIQRRREKMGVYVGIEHMEYNGLMKDHNMPLSPLMATGSAFSVAAGRLSYKYGLQGPCVSIDTACSSSLVGLFMAWQSAMTMSAPISMACGVNLMLASTSLVVVSIASMLSADGRCKTLDQSADGYVRAEACQSVIVDGTSEAMADVHCVSMVGSAVNQDGRSSSLTAPNGPSQQMVLQRALQSAHLSPEDVFGLQMHGTGTSLGDPVEVGALSAVLLGGTKSQTPLALSAVKSCVGHSEAAAGLSGILQLFGPLVMGTQSPLLHLRDVNPLVVNVLEAQAQKGGKSVQLPRYSSAECSDSESGVQSVYGASGFAFQGTNAHALLTPSNGSLLNASHKDRRSMSSTWKGVRCWIVSHQRSLLVEQFVLSSRSTNTATVETCLIGHPLLASLNEYDVCGRQVLCASAFVAMAAKTMEMLHANSDSRPWLVRVLFTSTLALSGEAVSSGVVQCQVALSSGNVLVRSKDEGTNSPHMTCSAHNLDTVDSSTSTEHHEVLDGARLYLGQSGSAGQGKLVPCQPSFEDEHALQGVGSLESSLHLMDSVTSSSSDGFELQARIPASVEACILSTSSLGVSLHAVGSATEVGRVTQSSQIDASPCLVDKLSFRVISSKEDISIPTVGGVSSSRDILDACKLYNICWYAQTPVVSSDVLTASEPATQLHVEESAICPHHILAGMQDLVEKGTDALWMHSSGSLDTSASPAGLHKDHGASGYMSWAMLRCIALECTSVQCGGVDTSPLHPSASARGLQFSSKSYAMDVTVDVFGCSMDNGSLYLPQLTLQRDTTQTHAVMNGSHHLGKGRRHVVTGGLSGIGQMVGGWCVRSSLGSSLGLLGRTGKSRTCPEELRAGDMSVSMARCDVSVREEASWWMMERCDDLYPLGMVVHAAGVLIDAILGNQSPSHMRGSLSPKLRGAQWIQAGSWSAALGATVHFSSISSLVGSPGQINYACSNSGLEMMSNRQKMSGIASLAIQWGIWKAVGMASNKVVSKRFESMGLAAISPDSGLSILSSCLHMKEEGTVCANQAAFWSNVLSSSTKCPSFFKQICPASIVDEIPKPHQEKRVVRSQHEVQPIIEQVSQSVQRLLQQDIDINTPLMEAGLDSLGVVELRNTISSSVGVQLPSTVILDYPSINALTTFICGELGLQEGKSVQELHEVLPSAEMGVTRCVALNSFSALLPVATTMKPGAGIGDAITSVPFGRWDLERSEAMMPSGQLTARFAGLLKDVSTFDTACFGMSVTEASLCDPQQRLLLQVSWESMQSCVLNDAQDSSNIQRRREKMGVYVGIEHMEYNGLMKDHNMPLSPLMATGSAFSVAAGRLSYKYGLQGPCVSIDTACSSSLVGLFMAWQSAMTMSAPISMACGVNLMLASVSLVVASIASMLSADGRCKTLDQSADGYVRAEACQSVIVDGTSEAMADAHCVSMVGSAVNQDGRSSSLTAPNGPSQQMVLQRALQSAHLSPEDVFGLQMHGTGTSLGDPVEVGALSAVLLGGTKSQTPLALSAVKSCVGHSEAAAGLSGILQLFGPLVMGTQSPLLHLRDVNPLVVNVLEAQAQKGGKSVQLPRYSSAECSDSESGVQSVYGASGFAFQGTNAHALLTPSNGSLLNASHKDRRSMSSTWKGVRCWIVSHQRSLLVEQFVLSSRSTNTATVETCLIGHPLLASLNEYDVCGRQVLCASAFVAMAAKTMEMLHANSDSRPWLVRVLFTSTLALSGEAVSSGVVQCQVALSSGNVLVRSKDEGTNSPHMTCSAHNLDTVDSSTSTEHHEVLDGARLYLGQSGSAGQGKLVPCQPSFEDEHALQGVGSLESSLHLMDSVTSSSSDGFELQARIPASVEACILSTSSLGVSLHAVGSATEVGRVTQSSQIDASPCLVDKLSFRVISSKEDISIPTVGGVSSSRDILDACKLYNICWYAQTPVVSSDVLTASEPATQLHVEESAICPHHILAGMQDLVEKGTDALWMHSSGSLDTSASPAGLHKDHGASGYMSWAMLRCIALECTSVQCGGVDTSPLHPSASARGLQFSSKSYAMDVTVDVFGCSMDNGSLYLPQLTLQRDTTQTHAVMNGSHHLGKGRRHVVTGGLSGIGQMVGGWCVRSSLGSSLGLLGRTGKSRTCPEELRAGDMSVSMARCDVSVREEASWWMMERCDDLYPLGMVVHAAGVLIDAILGNQSPSHMRGSLSPKLRGAQWIQAGSWSAALGATVHFSSLASALGNPKYTSYSASNAALDFVCKSTQLCGLPSMNFQWGVWGSIGMVTQGEKVSKERLARLSKDFGIILPTSGLNVLSTVVGAPRYTCNLIYTSPNYWNLFSSLVQGKPYVLGQVSVTPEAVVPVVPVAAPNVHSSAVERKNIQESISRALTNISGLDFGDDVPLMEAGLDSLGVVELRNTISSSVGVQLPSTVILDYPSINALTTFICGELGLQEGKSVQELHEVLPSAEMGVTRCVALNSFSALLPVATTMKPGAGIGDAITSVPFGRWDLERSEAMMPSGQLTARFAGLLKDVSTFDTACFGMSVTEASLCDPQQRLLLQVSWESMQSCVLNDAQDSSNIQRRREKMGVYVGIEHMEYNGLMKDHNMPLSPLMATGSAFSVAAGRLSYKYGLQGPCVSIDTACSSSLVGLCMAWQSAMTMSAPISMACGVNLMLASVSLVVASIASMLSADGRCKTLDQSADGYVRAEACQSVIVDGTSEAMADAHCVSMVGSAVNQDGRSSSLTAPNGPSQQMVLQRALQSAHLSPEDVFGLQMHGTGTSLGDPVEVGALSAVLLGGTKSQTPLALSAVKSCVGHSEAAAGLSGILQLFGPLVMGTQSPLLHLRDVNPLVVNVLEAQAQKGGKSVQLPRYSSAECSDSESGVQSVYGASGFAFQGTNAHALLTPSNGSLLNASHKDRRSMSSTWKGVRCWIVSHQRSLLVEQFVLSSRSTNTATVETCLIGHPLLASLNEYDVCGRQVLCASAFVAMAAKTMEMLHANSDSRPWLVRVLFTSTLALSGEAVSSGVVQCQVALSSGNVLVRSKEEGTNSPHMTCSAHNLDTVDSSTSTEHHEVLDGARLYLGQSGSAGQGKLVPCQPSFEDEHALQGVGSLESSLHLMDSVTSSSSDGFELQARIPASVEACILSTSSLGVSLHAVGSATEVGRVTQSSQIDASPCLVDKLSFRVISSKEDISIPTVGGVSSSRDILDACKLYNICWYAQTPVVSSDVLTASEPATQLHVEESAICPHHILAGMQDLVEKGTDALWMHSSGSLDTSASPAGLHKDHGASGYMSWAMLRCIALECTSVQCGGVDTSPLHPSASARGLQFSSKSYAMDVTVDVFGCSMDNGSLYLPQLTLQRDTTQTHAVMNGSHHLGKGRRHVVTGGLSGIGQMVGGWCVRSSLGSSLGLLGRTGKSRTCPEELRAGDMSVSMARCDVSVREEASWWMMERCDDLYPLGMVVHAAGVLIDAILGNQSPSHMRGSLSPKLRGAQWIQAGSWSAALGATVHFSSISSLVGSPGQINYACSNSGLEMMSNRQKMSGIASLAIQWGIWKAVGMASNKVVSKRFESMGLAAISPDSGLSILSSCLHMKEEGTVCANQAAFWSNVLSSSTKCPSFFKQICPASIVDEIPKPHQEKRVVRSQHEVQPIIEQVSQSVQRLLQQDIDINTPLMEAGLDSLGVVELRNTISSSVGVQLPSTVILDYPSINALTTFICGELGLQEGKSVQELHEVLPSAEMGVTRCVALNSFSALLPVATTMKPGAGIGDAITSVPFGRWDLERSEAMMPSGQLTARFAGLLKDVSTFDTACFGMSVTEASLCDPQQRLLLQVSWESMQSCVLNDAQDSSNIQRRREKMGVYVGIEHMEYNGLMKDHNMPLSPLMATGSAFSVAAGRLSYKYGLQGPCVSIDTACSSSLVGLFMAWQSAMTMSAPISMACGVNLMLASTSLVVVSIASMLSADGRCKTLDQSADGYVRAEACQSVIVDGTSEAMADVHCVSMVGSAVNQDGRSSSLTAPNGPSQQMVLQRALQSAHLSPEDVFGLQMHGTGTSLGDPVEVGALSAVLLGGTKSQTPLALSAVKSCVGHSEAAAGLSGILQLFGPLVMGTQSPLLHLRDVNPLVVNVLEAQAQKGGKAVQLPRYSSAECSDSESGVQSVYGASGFAFQGTNAHALLTPSNGSLLNASHKDRRSMSSTWKGVRCWIVSHQRSLLVEQFVLSSRSTNTATVETCLIGHPLLASLNEYGVCGRQVLCASAFVAMAAKTMEMLHANSDSRPWLVRVLFTSTLALSGEAVSSGVVQCQVALSSGNVLVRSKDEGTNSPHMTCSAHNLDTVDSSTSTEHHEVLDGARLYLGQSGSAGQGKLVPCQPSFEDEHALQGVGSLESSLHLMDSVTSSSSDGFELQARIPASVEACILSTSSLGVSLHAVGSATEVGRVTQSSQIDASPCLVDKLSFRVISSKEDISIPTVGGVSSSRDILDACKLYNICWYAQTPVVSSDVLTASNLQHSFMWKRVQSARIISLQVCRISLRRARTHFGCTVPVPWTHLQVPRDFTRITEPVDTCLGPCCAA